VIPPGFAGDLRRGLSHETLQAFPHFAEIGERLSSDRYHNDIEALRHLAPTEAEGLTIKSP
jgi:hypothetical protein